jgi:AraC family transcriptional regulator of adaptative response / DNA-3-methyladenine glycosylase II
VPRTVDGDEFAVRAVMGQQVSTAAARTATGSLVAAHGQPVSDPTGGLTHLFPSAEDLTDAHPALPGGRSRTLAHLVGALVDGRLDLGPGCDRDAARQELAAMPGVGPWTVEMVAMRALGDPDAFPVGDLGLVRGAGRTGLPDAARALTTRAEQWRPWRSYAVQHLWATSDHPINEWPPAGSGPTKVCEPRRPTHPTGRKQLRHA